MTKGRLFIITGPSCAGKTSVSNSILSSEHNIKRAVSFTTRKKRENEIDSVDYFFVSVNEFKKLILKNRFIEYTEVYGNFYGTSKESFNQIELGFDVIKDIDIQGALKIKELDIPAVFFFLAPKNFEILFSRINSERNTETVNLRIKAYAYEIKYKNFFNYYIDTSGDSNDTNIMGCAKKIIKLINCISTL